MTHNTRPKVMSYRTAKHFYAWLEKEVPEDTQHPVEQAIHKLMAGNPGEYPGRYSWRDVRRKAEHACAHEWIPSDTHRRCKFCIECGRTESDWSCI